MTLMIANDDKEDGDILKVYFKPDRNSKEGNPQV